MKPLLWGLGFVAWYGAYLISPRDVGILTAAVLTILVVAKAPEWFDPEDDDIAALLDREKR